ncbi:MAG: hypothetical protein Q4D61_00395 [Cardiobacteriaceae bacterium]|nr:hypothetical protein [Cardiobacteriaceae bacterium]
MRSLSFRRFQQKKCKQKAQRHLRNNLFAREERTPKRIGIHAATPKLCSCHMCGNPRRYEGEGTLQERKHGMVDELKFLDDE